MYKIQDLARASLSVSKYHWLQELISQKMKIFVALTLLVIATITAKDLRIDSQPGLGFPGSGMAYDCFLGIGWIFILFYSVT